jgi:hypothetical protein
LPKIAQTLEIQKLLKKSNIRCKCKMLIMELAGEVKPPVAFIGLLLATKCDEKSMQTEKVMIF